ncbi:alpha/beta hydrolase [Carnobacterium divergens]|uniref:alpha/beta hydrolase n=1 Tax=Carnobacterium divergens TaxID=2748 RepID=UPI003B9790D5
MMKRTTKIGLISILILTILTLGGLLTLNLLTYSPSPQAESALKSNPAVNVKSTSNATVFTPTKHKNDLSVLFYQGALVKEDSYSIWAKNLAVKGGYTVYLIHQPFHLAVLKSDIASDIIQENNIKEYIIGGHSLGGVIASRFAESHPSPNLKGVFFLASYPDEKGSLAKTNLPVLSITSDHDGVLNWDRYKDAKKDLPPTTTYQTITGGNHAGFGSYGPQKGDTSALISNNEQQAIISDLLLNWLDALPK